MKIVSKLRMLVAEEYEKQLDKVNKAADRAKDSIEKLDAAMDEHEKKKIPNGGSGLRKNECPTGEEMNYIIKFWFSFISDNFKEYNHILETRVKKIEKMIAALAVTNAAIIVMLIKVKCFLHNQ